MEPLQMNEKTVPELPENWVWTRLGGMLGFVKGKKPKNLGVKSELLTIPYINIKAFEHGVFNQFTDGDGCQLCKSDDTLIVWDGARCGLVGRGVTGAIGSTLAKLDYYGLKSPYLFYFLQTQYERINKRPRGVGIPHVEPELFWNTSFPLPPLPEQRHIVTKVEELFTRLDAGVVALTKAKAQLKRYHQSVLKSACEGRLVPTEAELARAEGRDYEHVDVLLARIGKERRKQWDAEKKRKGKKSTKYKEPAAPDVSGLSELPKGWCWVSLDQLIVHILAGKSFKCEERPPSQNEFGVVKVSAVTWGEFDETESKTCKNSEMIRDDFLIEEGDFLFSRANTIELVGACVIVKQISKRLMLSDKILRFGFAVISPKWVLVNLRTVFGRSEIERLATGNQDSMRNIGQDRIRQIRIPLPPLLEQHRIVAEIERRLTVADETEKTIDQSLKQAERLHRSILKRAFEGKLVPQDPDDEPASVLLKRIKAEKAKRGAEKKTKNKRKRKGNPKQKRLI